MDDGPGGGKGVRVCELRPAPEQLGLRLDCTSAILAIPAPKQQSRSTFLSLLVTPKPPPRQPAAVHHESRIQREFLSSRSPVRGEANSAVSVLEPPWNGLLPRKPGLHARRQLAALAGGQQSNMF